MNLLAIKTHWIHHALIYFSLITSIVFRKHFFRKLVFLISINLKVQWRSHTSRYQKTDIKYRKYKHFYKNKFEKEILSKLSKCNKETFHIDEFKLLFIPALNICAPLKGIVKWAEPYKSVILLILRILWH